MAKRLQISLLILAALAVVAFFVFKNQTENLPKDDNVEQGDVTLESYSSDLLGITLTYPNSLSVDEADDGRVTFSMLGPSQEEFTELYDGVGVSFFRGVYDAETFDEFVNLTLADWEVNGTITDDLREVKLADLDGYTFEGTGQGVYRFYLLPVAESQALQIVVFVADPTGQGFQGLVDDMLASLTVQ